MFRLVTPFGIAAALTFGCDAPPAPSAPEPTVPAENAAAPETTDDAPLAADDQPQSQPSSAPTAPTATDGALAPHEELAAMDPRTPVPLQPMMAWHQKQNMMEHLVAIERITAGLVNEDWSAIAEASALIESSPQMQQMCQHMGAGADGFTELALEFHRRADAIGEAARAEDATGVLRATAHTLGACTSCHASFRQHVVDAPTWELLTGSSHVPMGH